MYIPALHTREWVQRDIDEGRPHDCKADATSCCQLRRAVYCERIAAKSIHNRIIPAHHHLCYRHARTTERWPGSLYCF